MAIATEQLETINREITEAFSKNRKIEVLPVEGNPPDSYEITYKVTGLQKSGSGEVEEAESHIVSMSIPFGFPHFPPSCKPKSPIFHPDFDPAAICIGDFWEKNRSIEDLILHIRDMIAGKIYSTSNAFNEEAAQWYTEKFSQPEKKSGPDPLAETGQRSTETDIALGDDFTSLLDDNKSDAVGDDLLTDFEPDDDSTLEPALSFVDEPETREEAQGEETLSDLFQESDFDFEPSTPAADDVDGGSDSGGEDDDLLPADFSVSLEKEVVEETVDRKQLEGLAAEKRFFGLDKELSSLSADTLFDGRDNLAEEAAAALEQAQSLYTRALEYEHQGEPERALRCLKQIADYTTDYPGLQQDISRITQALELLGDWTEADKEKTGTAPQPSPKTGVPVEPVPPPRPSPKKEPIPGAPESRTFFDDGNEEKSRLIPYAILITLLLVGAAGGINYYLSANNYKKAADNFAACRASLKKNHFTDAEQQCEAALGVARQIFLFKTSDRDQLVGEIERTLRAKPLKEGLAGNLLLDGNYFPRQVVQDIQTFRKFKQEGDTLFGDSKWQHAVSNYEQALDIATREEAIDRQQVFLISENIKIARFRITYESAISYIDRKKWVLATNDFNTALEQLKTLDIEDKASIIDDITNRLSGIAQATEREKGDLAFQISNWNEAAAHYRKALTIAQQAPDPDNNIIYELKQLVVKGDLYSIISTGKSAFRNAQWDMAIDSYDHAITLLEDNRELLKQANTEENRKKLARILLQAAVIRDKQSAARHLKEREYDQAIDKLQAIIESVSASDFAEEQVFLAALDEAGQSIEQAQTDRLLEDKIIYLEDNFEALFTKHYSGSPPESLTDRTVIFEKQVGDILLFRLQCVEIGHGRPLQLVMKYAHNLKTGTWRFHSDAQ